MRALERFLGKAFLHADALEANAALSRAREGFPGERERVFSFEVTVPAASGRAWLEGELLPKLVYFCESRKAPLPGCAGVFVSFFVGEKLACVSAADVVAIACEELATSPAALVARFGTGELRKPVLALPGPDEEAT